METKLKKPFCTRTKCSSNDLLARHKFQLKGH